MAEGGEKTEELKLPEVFKEIWKIYDILEKTEESTSSDKNQGYVRHACELCKTAIDMINKLQLFSDNEDVEEVSTNELKYMLLPALHGYFLMKCTVRNRLRVVKESQDFFTDYLRLCKSYKVTNVEVPGREEPELTEQQQQPSNPVAHRPSPADVRSMAFARNSKIQRYKEQKELDKKINELRDQVEKDHVDEEIKRDYYMSLMKRWVNVCVEELDSINSEITILEMMEQRKANGDKKEVEKKKTEHKPTPLRPFIITKDMLQKQVYGLGYPSIPTMTIEEFMDEKIAQGEFNVPSHGHSMQDWALNPDKDKEDQEKESAEKEERIERDDPDERKRIQEMDEYKDEHRRGWGNRKNMG